MPEKPIKLPNPSHPITIEPTPGRVVVMVAGRIVADTTRALTLREASYPPVYYVPREDAEMTLMARSNRSTYCPYKGDAAYYGVPVGGGRSADAVWTYEAPYAAVAAIKDHLASIPNASTRSSIARPAEPSLGPPPDTASISEPQIAAPRGPSS